jgi:DNA topoisomerase I
MQTLAIGLFEILGRGNWGHAGRPGKKGGSMPRGGTAMATKRVGGKLVQKSGKPLPDYIQKLAIPPAWTNVEYNNNKNAAVLVRGRDNKGRVVYVRSEVYDNKKAEAKYNRVKELTNKFDAIAKENEKNLRSKDPQTKENAAVLKLIMETGIRPGSKTFTGAEKKAYGATTLEGRHVKKIGNRVELHFVGKKGISLKIPVTNKVTADSLVKRSKAAGSNGKLFNTHGLSLSKYTKKLDGGGFKTKDFRTSLGTYTAKKMVEKLPAPKSVKEYKRLVKSVAKVVAEKLGNTATVALQAYINPTVFSEWRV